MTDDGARSSRMFPACEDSRLQALFDLGERIWNGRQDLQEAYPRDRLPEFWSWLVWQGAKEYEEVRDRLLPLPPTHLIARVFGGQATPEEFLQGGLVDGQRMETHLREAGFDFQSGVVLDFAAGCGRLMQFFALHAGRCELHAADIDAEAMQWCENQLDFIHATTVGRKPPTPYSDQQFDAIYSFSLFSHLPEQLHRAWLEELHRISQPGAAVVLTTLGRTVSEEVLRGKPGWDPAIVEKLEASLPEWERSGFLFLPYREISFDHPENEAFFKDWDMDEYGVAFVQESYLRKRWLDLFDLVSFHEGPDRWQDYAVLRRRQ